MTALSTYDELRAAIADWLTRDDLDTVIPQFISLAETRLAANVFAPERIGTTTLTTPFALPVDFDGARVIWIDGNPRTILDPMEYGQLLEAYPVAGAPEKYAVTGANLALGPSPQPAVTLNVSYWKKLPGLGVSNPTNWLLAFRPDLYLSACLAEGCLYLKDESRWATWEGITQSRIADASKDALKRWYSAAPLIPRAANVP